jgi:hypothetical protein
MTTDEQVRLSQNRIKLPYVRMAISGVGAIVCLLLVGLHVRSYSPNRLLVGWGPGVYYNVLPACGRLFVEIVYDPSDSSLSGRDWEWSVDEGYASPMCWENRSRMAFTEDPLHTVLVTPDAVMPIWAFVLLAASMALAPWFLKLLQYPLGTLLIPAGLFAVVFGFAVYLDLSYYADWQTLPFYRPGWDDFREVAPL